MSFGNDWFPLGICAYGDVLFSNTSFSKCANLLSVNTGFVLSSGNIVVLWCREGKGVRGVVLVKAGEGFPRCEFKHTLRHR